MQKGSTIITFEFDESETTNFNKLLEVSGMVNDYDADYPLEVQLDVTFNFHYDKGRYYGAPENCYQSEFEFELDSVKLNNTDVSKILDDKQWDKISDTVIENFDDYLNELREDAYENGRFSRY